MEGQGGGQGQEMGSRIKDQRLGSEVRAGSQGSESSLTSGYQVGVRNRKRMGRGRSEKSVPDLRSWVSARVWTETRGGGPGWGFSLEGVGAVPPVHGLQHFSVNPERDGAAEQQQGHVGGHGHDAKMQEA